MQVTSYAALDAVQAACPEAAFTDAAPPDEAHACVARALRGGRARTGLGEHQVVEKLAARGCEIGLTGLRRAEQSGEIGLAHASALADLYGTTTDCLAGRRLNRQSLPALSPERR